MPDRTYSPNRVLAANGCAAGGVLPLIVAGLSPEGWYPVIPLFLGLALLAVAHVLTPCEDRIAVWRKMRASGAKPPDT